VANSMLSTRPEALYQLLPRTFDRATIERSCWAVTLSRAWFCRALTTARLRSPKRCNPSNARPGEGCHPNGRDGDDRADRRRLTKRPAYPIPDCLACWGAADFCLKKFNDSYFRSATKLGVATQPIRACLDTKASGDAFDRRRLARDLRRVLAVHHPAHAGGRGETVDLLSWIRARNDQWCSDVSANETADLLGRAVASRNIRKQVLVTAGVTQTLRSKVTKQVRHIVVRQIIND